MTQPLLSVRGLSKVYGRTWSALGIHGRAVDAVVNLSFEVEQYDSLGIVGESGSGKTTVARLVSGLDRPTSGAVVLDGMDLDSLSGAALRGARARVHLIFQDAYDSLDPGMRVADIVSEPTLAHERASRHARHAVAENALSAVQLPAAYSDKYPHQLSGGERQMVAIARAIASGALMFVYDEPTSSLDVSVQAQILNLLNDVHVREAGTRIFISHNLGVIRYVASRVAVMLSGRIVEMATTDNLYGDPQHPYTVALLRAVPRLGVSRVGPRLADHATIREPLLEWSATDGGCPYYRRCPSAQLLCSHTEPLLLEHTSGHFVACHYPRGTDQTAPVLPFGAAT